MASNECRRISNSITLPIHVSDTHSALSKFHPMMVTHWGGSRRSHQGQVTCQPCSVAYQSPADKLKIKLIN